MVFGWIFAAHQIGAATAAFGAGLSRTAWLTYSPALYVAGAACIVAGLLALMVRRPALGQMASRRKRLAPEGA
jgi:hypothetical protein